MIRYSRGFLRPGILPAAAALWFLAWDPLGAIGIDCNQCPSPDQGILCRSIPGGDVDTTCYLYLTHPTHDLESCSQCDCSVPSTWVCDDQWNGTQWEPVTCAYHYDYINCVPLGTFVPTLYENGYLWAPTATQAAYGPPPVKGMADTHDHVFGEYAFGGGWFKGRVADAQPPTTCSGNQSVDMSIGLDDMSFYDALIAMPAIWCVMEQLLTPAGFFFDLTACLGPIVPALFTGMDDTAYGDHDVMKVPNGSLSGFFGEIGKHSTSGWPRWSGTGHQQLWEGWLREAHEKAPFEYWIWHHVYVQDAAGDIAGFQPGYEAAMMAFAATDPLYAGQSFVQLQDDVDAQVALFRSQYVANMQEAYDAGAVGLNLIVVSAVNFREFCGLMRHENYGQSNNHEFGGSLDECHDAMSLAEQLDAAHSWLARPEVAPWAGLARSAGDARSLIVDQGRLAVVLSLESSDVMDEPEQTASVQTQIADYHDQDVRTLQLIHEMNNRFGGASAFNILFGTFEALRNITGSKDDLLWALYSQDRVSDMVAWTVDTLKDYGDDSWACYDATHINFSELCDVEISPFNLDLSIDCSGVDNLLEDVQSCVNALAEQGFECTGNQPCFDCVANFEHGCIFDCSSNGSQYDCPRKNVRGLTADGQTAVGEMAARGLPIDLAHMDEATLQGVDSWLLGNSYCNFPVYVSHGHVREALIAGIRSEKTMSPATIDLIARRGGLVGIRTGPESTLTFRPQTSGGAVQGSTWSYAQSLDRSWKHAVNVSFGVDMNGLIQMTRPRCESQTGGYNFYSQEPPAGAYNISCPGLDEGFGWCTYELATCPTTAVGTEFDWRGLAHIGLLPDFMQDLIQLDTKALDPGTVQPQTMNLLYGAGAYVAMWERAEKLSHAPQWQQNGWSCGEIENLMWTHEDLLDMPHPFGFGSSTPIVVAVEDQAQVETVQGLITRNAVVGLDYDWAGSAVSVDMPLHGAVGRYLAETEGQRAALNGASPWSDLGPAGTVVWSAGSTQQQCDDQQRNEKKGKVVGCGATWSLVPGAGLSDPVIPEGAPLIEPHSPPIKHKPDPAVQDFAEDCTSACQPAYDACLADADCAPCLGEPSGGGGTQEDEDHQEKKAGPCSGNSLYNSFTRCFSVHCGGVKAVPFPTGDPIPAPHGFPDGSPLD